jgi:hypothetical protein
VSEIVAPTYSRDELDETGGSIAATQHASGMIPWFPGGHADPWNHVEAAMALTVTGRIREAERAYEWLASTQRSDGAWHAYYASDESVEEPRLDTNVTAYVATGVHHHYLATKDRGFLEQMWPVVDAALGFVLAHQRPGGELTWAVDPDGTPGSFALLTASSSACTSLDSGVALAGTLGLERPSWERALNHLVDAVANRPAGFAAKDEFAMDWYYPMLCGAVTGDGAASRLRAGWQRFVIDGHGVRCRSDGSWVTAAETAECALACVRLGRDEQAAALLSWTRSYRRDGGTFATGLVHPGGNEFPEGERSTYSAAAIVLAADVLAGAGASRAIFAPEVSAER